MTKAVRIHNYGGPEALRYEDVADDLPSAGQVRLKQTAIGLNFIDIYYRNGVYKVPQMPVTLGCEAAGVIEALGEGVTEFKVGDRVCYGGGFGGYAEARTMPADRLIKIPDGLTDKQAAAMTLQGMTAQYLLRLTYRVKKGDTILVHAAAGGVGLIMCQWAKHLGATVIGTVGSEAKAKLAADHGCDHPVIYTKEDYVARVKQITGGAMLPVVYDSIGKDTFRAFARLPGAARPDGQFRQCLWQGRSGRSADPQPEGLAVPHPPDALQLQHHARRIARQRARAVRRGAVGRREDRDRPDLQAEGRRASADRPGGAQDDGLDDYFAVGLFIAIFGASSQ